MQSYQVSAVSEANATPHMHDRYSIHEVLPKHPKLALLVVYDGYGGHEIAEFLQTYLPTYINNLQNPMEFTQIGAVCSELDETIRKFSTVHIPSKIDEIGSSCLIAIIDKENRNILAANVGGCTIAIFDRDSHTVDELTPQHTIGEAKQIQEIQSKLATIPENQAIKFAKYGPQSLLQLRGLNAEQKPEYSICHVSNHPTSETEILKSPFYRTFGFNALKRKLDRPDILSAAPEFAFRKLEKNQVLILCSQGVTQRIGLAPLLQPINKYTETRFLPQQLYNTAKSFYTLGNCTIIAFSFC